MKKMILCVGLFFSLFSLHQANAQVRVNVNIGIQPNWGPVGYDYVEYYYIPDIEAYYYVPKHQFVHLNPAGKWVFSNGLPAKYRTYDLYSGYKVVINQPTPYLYFNTHRIQYVGYRGNRGQAIIKNSNDPKYKMHKVKSTGNTKVKPVGKSTVKVKSTGNNKVKSTGKAKSSGKGSGKGNH